MNGCHSETRRSGGSIDREQGKAPCFHIHRILFLICVNSFTRHMRLVGVHITHNGDFDALEAYGGSMVNAEVGHWLERILHVKNDLAGDSVKVSQSYVECTKCSHFSNVVAML